MKNLFGGLLVLLGFANPSFAVIFDALLEDTHTIHGVCKVFGGIKKSQIYGAGYPEVPIVHPYHHEPLDVPFSGTISKATLPLWFEALSSTEFPGYTSVFSFVVQGMPEGRYLTPTEVITFEEMKNVPPLTVEKKMQLKEADLNNYESRRNFYESIKNYCIMEQNKHFVLPHNSLKPQYLIHSGCPTLDKNTREHKVWWTAMPGAEGQVEPEKGTNLLPDAVSTHPIGLPLINVEILRTSTKESDKKEYERLIKIIKENNLKAYQPGIFNADDINSVPNLQRFDPDFMILSGDCMHLKGIHPFVSTDFYDLVAFEENNNKILSITYRWMLSNNELETFKNHLEKTETLRGLMTSLESENSFIARLCELSKYVEEPINL